LTLPYYGAETFGLHAIGELALKEHNAALLSLANAVRWEQGLVFILVGLFLLAVGTILFAIALWRSEGLPRWSGIALAVSPIAILAFSARQTTFPSSELRAKICPSSVL